MVNRKRTREDILESVIDTIHRKGLQGTGLNELFAVSGISSGSFYNYFRSKYELGHALIDFEWSKLNANILEPAFSAHEDPIAQVLEMINRLEARQLAQPNCAGCLLGNLVVDLVEQDESFRVHLAQVFDAWEQQIASALRAGHSQLNPNIDPDVLAQQLIAHLEGVMVMGRLRRDPERLRHSFEGVRNFLKSCLAYPQATPFCA